MNGLAQFLVWLLIVLVAPAAAAQSSSGPLTPEQASALAEQGDLLLIDVRTPAEWRQSGVPSGAALVDLVGSGTAEAFVRSVLAVTGGDRDRPIATICRTNNRAQMAQSILSRAGFTDVTFVSEGVVPTRVGPGWINRGLPTGPCGSC